MIDECFCKLFARLAFKNEFVIASNDTDAFSLPGVGCERNPPYKRGDAD
jgi:hypothetical protein